MDNLEIQISIVLEKENQNTSRRIVYFISQGKIIDNYETYETLIDIYSNIQNDAKKKEQYLDYLLNAVRNHEFIDAKDCIGDAHLAVYTLIKLGFAKKVLLELKKRGQITFLIPEILQILVNDEFKYFDDEDLSEIKQFYLKQLNRLDNYSRSTVYSDTIAIYARDIVDIRFDNLKKAIKSVNLEINLDKQVVNEKIGYLGFDIKFTELLNEIDVYMNTDTSKFVNAAMIGNLRVFMEDIFKDIANRISSKLGEEIPKIEGKGEMGNIRTYIKNKLELHDNEDKFMNNFINILHTEGGHSFTSEKEYFRLARNIAIELALLLLSKFEKIYMK